jgi:GNAT superfamily N-acetyltransferase
MSPGGHGKTAVTATQRWLELLRQGHRGAAAGPGEQPPSQVVVRTDAADLVVSGIDNGLSEHLDRELCAFNAEVTGHRDLQPLRIEAREDDGGLLAGLAGSTWGGCGYIDLIWVRADRRRCGLGSQLLAAGETEIRRRGCDQVALSTYSFQAPAFYLRSGYTECGRRTAFPHGYDQILYVKRLS